MTPDLSVLYYSAHRIPVRFQEAVILELRRSLSAIGSPLIIAVCQWARGQASAIPLLEPDETIYIENAQLAISTVYRNVLAAAKAATTPYVACCEDDTVYAPSHFHYRPPLDTFGYDLSRWVITRKRSDDGRRREAFYYWRRRHQMAMCIAPRALLIETLEEKFAKYPTPPLSTDVAKKAGWGEPGRYEINLKLTPRKLTYFQSPEPSVTFNHGQSLMGRRRVNPDDIICDDLAPWGSADALWARIHG